MAVAYHPALTGPKQRHLMGRFQTCTRTATIKTLLLENTLLFSPSGRTRKVFMWREMKQAVYERHEHPYLNPYIFFHWMSDGYTFSCEHKQGWPTWEALIQTHSSSSSLSCSIYIGILQDEPMRFLTSFTGVSATGNFYPLKYFKELPPVGGSSWTNDHKLHYIKYQQLTKLKDRHCKKNITHTHNH